MLLYCVRWTVDGQVWMLAAMFGRLDHQVFEDLFDFAVVGVAVYLALEEVALAAVTGGVPVEGHVAVEVHGAGGFDVPVGAQAADGEEDGCGVGDVATFDFAVEVELVAE